MSRATPEWIGKDDNTPIPPRVKLRVFEAHGGVCHLSGRKIRAGEPWDCDHVKALINGGENRETNLAPALRDKHRIKTAQDVAEKADTYRRRSKHLGLKQPSRLTHPTLKRGFDGKVRPRAPLMEE
jgi:5-methylcytosine-specific restriction endonuclease McrA